MNSKIKNITFIILASSSIYSKSNAQVVLNNSVNPTIGSRTLFISIDSAFYKPGASGPNCIWNFSDILRQDSTYLYYVDAKQTPYLPYFNNANIVMTTDNQNFDFFKFDETGYYSLGSIGYEPTENTRTYSRFLHQEPMLRFPLQMGDSFNISNSRISDYIGSFTNYQSISTKFKADANGTLILGKDTFFKTLRINETTVFNDSFSNGQRFILSKQILNKYQWYSNGIQAPLLTLDQTMRVFKGDSTVSNTNSIVGLENKTDFKPPFPERLIFNQATNQYELHLEIKNAQKLSVAIPCQANCKTQKRSKSPNQNTYYFEVKQGNNVLSFSAADIIKNNIAGEPVEFIVRGINYNATFYLLIP